MKFNERFGQGAASYVDVRDSFAVEEYIAWSAHFNAWDELADERAKDKEHDDAMTKAAAAAGLP